MNITIMPNLDKKNSAACTREVSRKLHSLGVGVYLDECYKKEFSDCPVLFAPYDEVVERCDVIIAIGGDGTIIRHAKSAALHGKRLFGINEGRAIVDPALETIEMVAIAPHSLLSRPILFSPDSVLIVTAQQRSEQSHAYFSVDGEAEIPLFTGGRISIRRSPVYVELIDLGGKAFYEVLQKKIIGRG